MRTAVFAVTKNGLTIAKKIQRGLRSTVDIYTQPGDTPSPWLLDAVGDAFEHYDALVFICAVGIAVRAVAPHVSNKATDPAVVVVDDAATFSISLLSGHIGGANDLAREVADLVCAMPVITTATDIGGKPAIDLMMKDLGLKTGDKEGIRRVSTGIVNGDSACVFADIRLGRWGDRLKASYSIRPLPQLNRYENDYNHVVVIVNDVDAQPSRRDALVLRTRRVFAGVGCRKDVSTDEVRKAVKKALAQAGLRKYNLKGFASIDIKRDESALVETATDYGVGLALYPAEELDRVAPSESSFVKEQVGTGGVCEPAAILASKGGTLTLPKTVYGNVTVALAEEE